MEYDYLHYGYIAYVPTRPSDLYPTFGVDICFRDTEPPREEHLVAWIYGGDFPEGSPAGRLHHLRAAATDLAWEAGYALEWEYASEIGEYWSVPAGKLSGRI